MKSWVKILSLIAAVTGCLTAHAQLATINADLPTAPDSIIRVTAEAQGLPLMSRDAIPRGGTFWLYLPGTISAPLPCPMIISNYPIYAITGNQYIMDGTGGQVAPRRRPGGRPVTSEMIAGALEAQAQSVIDFIASTLDNQLRQAARALGFDVPNPGEGGGGGTNGVGGGMSNYQIATTNDLWLEATNIINTINAGTGMTVTLLIHPPWNVTNGVYDIFATTYLAPTDWQWVVRCDPGQTSLTLTNRPAQMEMYRLGLITDSDGDGLTDAYENLVSHTDRYNPDSDGDGISDGDEIMNATDPLTANPAFPATLTIQTCPL